MAIAGDILLGGAPGSEGRYEIDGAGVLSLFAGGSVVISGGLMDIHALQLESGALVQQSGGVIELDRSLLLDSRRTGVPARYTISDGSVSAPDIELFSPGNSFEQQGGTVTARSLDLTIDVDNAYELGGGTLSVARNIHIEGTLTATGGLAEVDGRIDLMVGGQMHLQGGTLRAEEFKVDHSSNDPRPVSCPVVQGRRGDRGIPDAPLGPRTA